MVLVFDVAAYEVLVESDGGDEVSACPEGLLFVESVGAFNFLLHPGGGLALQYLHDVRDGISGGREEYEVDMVFLNIEFDDFPVFPFADRLEYPPQFTLHLLGTEYLATVLRRPDEVVFEVVEAMG